MKNLFLTQTINMDINKEYSEILNVVSLDLDERKSKLSSSIISNQYKSVSEVIKAVEKDKVKPKKKKNLKELLQISFFHGATWMGDNFIA